MRGACFAFSALFQLIGATEELGYKRHNTISLDIIYRHMYIRTVLRGPQSLKNSLVNILTRGLVLVLLLVSYAWAQRPRRDCGTTFRQHFEVQETRDR